MGKLSVPNVQLVIRINSWADPRAHAISWDSDRVFLFEYLLDFFQFFQRVWFLFFQLVRISDGFE